MADPQAERECLFRDRLNSALDIIRSRSRCFQTPVDDDWGASWLDRPSTSITQLTPSAPYQSILFSPAAASPLREASGSLATRGEVLFFGCLSGEHHAPTGSPPLHHMSGNMPASSSSDRSSIPSNYSRATGRYRGSLVQPFCGSTVVEGLTKIGADTRLEDTPEGQEVGDKCHRPVVELDREDLTSPTADILNVLEQFKASQSESTQTQTQSQSQSQ
jgi:hypothetical protein